MAVPTAKPGILAAFYLNSGNFATPTWGEITSVGNLTENAAWKQAEVETRLYAATQYVKTTIDLGVSFNLLASDSGDANYTSLISAIATRDVVDVMVLDGSSTSNGARGWRFEGQVFQANKDQGTQAVITPDFEVRPTVTLNPPQSVLVTAGSPVFTNLVN